MEINKKYLNRIGLDRVKILVEIESIDLSKIKDIENLAYAEAGESKYISIVDRETGEYIRIKGYKYIADGYGIYVTKEFGRIVVFLDITKPRVYYNQGHNVYNIYTEDQAKETLELAKKYLEENGIYLNSIEHWKVRVVEINKTYECNIQRERYMDCLKYIYDNVNRDHKYKYSSKAKLEKNNIVIYWEDKDIQIYDKTAQMLDKYDKKLDSQIYRTELTYTDKASIEGKFGSNNIDILYDFEKISEVYESEMNRLEEFMEKSINDDIGELRSKEVEGIGKKDMQLFYNQNSDKLFDISYMASIFSDEYKKRGANKFNRDFGELFKMIDEHKKYRHEDLVNLLSAMVEKDYKFTPKHNKNVNKFMYRK